MPGIVDAATSVTEQAEEDDIELIPESPCIDEKLSEVMSSSCSMGSQPVGWGGGGRGGREGRGGACSAR